MVDGTVKREILPRRPFNRPPAGDAIGQISGRGFLCHQYGAEVAELAGADVMEKRTRNGSQRWRWLMTQGVKEVIERARTLARPQFRIGVHALLPPGGVP